MSARRSAQDIRRAALRIAGYADEITRAHVLGIAPGYFDEPWTVEYQKQALVIYRLSLPDAYLAELADHFGKVARAIAPIAPDDESWEVVHSYLESASQVLGHLPPRHAQPSTILESSTPSLIRVGDLAALVSRIGAKQLSYHANAVARAAGPIVLGVSVEELQVARHIHNGLTRMEISVELAMSERTVYRRQVSFCNKCGANDIAEALTIATDLGLFDD